MGSRPSKRVQRPRHRFFMKRMTDKRPIPPELMLRQFPVAMLDRVAAA